jgi:hypothetical protein
MLRVLVVLVALTGVARADLASEARSKTDAAFARYDDKIGGRNPLLKVYDLIDSSMLDNVKASRKHLVEAKEAFDKAWKAHEETDAKFKLADLESEVKSLDREIDDYSKWGRTTMWKILGGLIFLGVAVFGGAIYAVFLRLRSRRR